MKLAGRRGKLQVITIDGRLTGLAVSLQPLPGAKGDELIAAKVNRRAGGLFIGFGRIEFEKFLAAGRDKTPLTQQRSQNNANGRFVFCAGFARKV